MGAKSTLSKGGRVYLAAVICGGGIVVLHSLLSLYAAPVGYEWFVLAGLTLLSGSFTVRIPTIPARLSVSETFVFASVLLFGPAAATMIVVLDSLVISLWQTKLWRGRRALTSVVRVLFNVAAPSIAIWVAAHLFYLVAQVQPLGYSPRSIVPLLAPLMALALVYFWLNSWLIACAVAFESAATAFVIWRRNFLWLSLNYFSGASVAALLLPYLQLGEYAFVKVIGVLLPLLVISYLTFKTALGRVEDANHHLSELNRLYLSTIETLAMAIDAKDQITHGHIRRVQVYAVGLAKAMGLSEDAQIKAVEAAALLHDMGKLAVPEYILNKPGPLTPAEFEKMKLHASVGADILSAIDFPYPVVPIVRHHHENWDGTGYPDRVSGSDIPIGARILSVVDCFDALTSDRPYRPRLSDSEAIRILLDRRGQMYDPIVVDTFVRVYRQISPDDAGVEAVKPGLAALNSSGLVLTAPSIATSRFDDISASTEEMLMLYELARSLSGKLDVADAADVISKHLRRLIPATVCVFYVYDAAADELLVAHAAGDSAAHFTGLRIPMGERLSGWVGANRQTIVNSDPMLDLGEVARALRPPLRSCLSTPMNEATDLVGVLTVYSMHRDAFSEDHRRLIEIVARQVSRTIKHAVLFQRERAEQLRDHFTGLPNRQHFERFIASEAAVGTAPSSIVVVEALRGSGGHRRPKPDLDQQLLGQIADTLRRCLRTADLLFQYDATEFVVLLTDTDANVTAALVQRITERLAQLRSQTAGLSFAVGVAVGQQEGLEIPQLLEIARTRKQSADDSGRPSIH
jgi:diguanylate cyclase (GGDEF)-like protein/putative nucleotidyltransferase with HDIG domain